MENRDYYLGFRAWGLGMENQSGSNSNMKWKLVAQRETQGLGFVGNERMGKEMETTRRFRFGVLNTFILNSPTFNPNIKYGPAFLVQTILNIRGRGCFILRSKEGLVPKNGLKEVVWIILKEYTVYLYVGSFPHVLPRIGNMRVLGFGALLCLGFGYEGF